MKKIILATLIGLTAMLCACGNSTKVIEGEVKTATEGETVEKDETQGKEEATTQEETGKLEAWKKPVQLHTKAIHSLIRMLSLRLMPRRHRLLKNWESPIPILKPPAALLRELIRCIPITALK